MTMKGLRGTNLVAVITYPEEGGIQTRQWADWIAFFEFKDGSVSKWPDQVQVPQWTGDKGFPAIILPKNGSLATADWSELTRTYVTLNSEKGYVGSHSTISGVQWYARNEGMRIANPAIAKDQKTGQAVVVNESPQTLPDTVGSIAPSGYATFVWVSNVTNNTIQFVTIRNGEAVLYPSSTKFIESITFTDPKLFPAIVWEGEGFPNDDKLRNMSITWATVGIFASGKGGPLVGGSSVSLANSAKSQLVTAGGQKLNIVDSSVTKWFPKKPGSNADQGAPDPGQSGGGSSGGSSTSRDRVANAIAGVQLGHHLGSLYPIPWFTGPGQRRDRAPNVGQALGGSVVMGAAKTYREMQGSALWNSNMDGSETRASMLSVADRRFDAYNTWYVAMACNGWTWNANAMYQVRRARVYVLPKGQTKFQKVYDENGSSVLGTWCSDFAWDMGSNPAGNWNGTGIKVYPDGSYGNVRKDLQVSRSGGIATHRIATRPELVSHGGSNDVFVPGLRDIDYDGILVEYEARLHPDWTHAKIAFQMGMDAKINGHNPPGGWFVGMGLSNLRLLTPDWQTFRWCNAKSGQDSGRGGIACDDARLLSATLPD